MMGAIHKLTFSNSLSHRQSSKTNSDVEIAFKVVQKHVGFIEDTGREPCLDSLRWHT